MRISAFLDYDGDASGPVRTAMAAEAAGLDQVWSPEAYGFDGVSMLGYLAAKTERIGLASGILPLGTRTASLLAMSAAGIDVLSGGRFTLGLGTSGPQVIEGFHGATFDRPIDRTRDTIEICRLVWEREPLVYKGRTVELPPEGVRALKLITTPLRSRIPITIASMGPRNVELTAELAEGWLPMLGMFDPTRWQSVWGDAIAAGTAKRDPALGALDVVAGAEVSIGPDGADDRGRARALIALYVGGMGSREQNFYNDLFRRYGYEEEAKTIQDLYLGRDRKGAAAAVPSEFLEATSLCGDEDFVRGQVQRYKDAGVTNLVVRAVGKDDPEATFRTLRAIVDDVAPE